MSERDIQTFLEKAEEQAKRARSMPELVSRDEIQDLGVSLFESVHRIRDVQQETESKMHSLREEVASLRHEARSYNHIRMWRTVLMTLVIALTVGGTVIGSGLLVTKNSETVRAQEFLHEVEMAGIQAKKEANAAAEAERQRTYELEAAKLKNEQMELERVSRNEMANILSEEHDQKRAAMCQALSQEKLAVESFMKRMASYHEVLCLPPQMEDEVIEPDAGAKVPL